MLRGGDGGPWFIYKCFREISVSSSVIFCRVIDAAILFKSEKSVGRRS